MARKFGKVGSNLDRSEKWWALPDDQCRLAYTWLLWCRHGSPIGIWEMPPALMASGLYCTPDRAEEMLAEMDRAGLIDRGPDDLIRITRWWLEQNSPRHPSAAVISINGLRPKSVPDCQARTNAVVEFAYAATQASASWDRSTEKYRQFEDGLLRLLVREAVIYPERLDEALQAVPPAEAGQSLMWARTLERVQREAGSVLREMREREGNVRERERNAER